MSDKDEPKNPLEDFQKQLHQMMRDGKFQFMFPGSAPGAQAGAAPPPARESDDRRQREEALKRIREFNLRPREIRDYLDRFVIRQEEAKKVVSVAICDHYNHVRRCLENPELREKDYAKQNILILGPTGVGKTYLMRNVAKLVGVPFVKADATKFSETGYVGGDVDDLVRDLVKAADGDVELAQYGIVYVDEIDKINASAGAMGRDVSGRGVQINLLKLMEDTEVNLQSQTDILGQMSAVMEMQRGGKPRPRTINTRHILFIVSGAFDKLAGQVRRRVESAQVGFAHSGTRLEDDSDALGLVQTQDFIQYGFEPEFVGRLPVRVACRHLDPDDLENILLTSEGSVLAQYRADFAGYGIDFDIQPEAIRAVARKAHAEKTGARGLMTVLERLFRDFKFELPSTGIRSFTISPKTLEDPAGEVRSLLRLNSDAQRDLLRGEVADFSKRFQRDHGFDLEFADDAIAELVDESLRRDKTIRGLCEEKFRDFHHGLTLIARGSGTRRFRITRAVVANPEHELSQWVVASFRESGRAAGASEDASATN
jgi:endopeptidase Clp ATP-binding regulatory subunit ClpX